MIDNLGDLLAQFQKLQLPEFFNEARCADEDPKLFDGDDEGLTFKAVRICRDCPIQTACAQWAVANETGGVWGGMTPKDLEKAQGGKRAFITMEERRRDLDWIADIMSDKPAVELAEKYGKSERTIYRWRRDEKQIIAQMRWIA